MSRIVETRLGPGLNYNTTFPDNLVELHADGIGDVMMTSSMAKLTLYQTRPADLSKTSQDPLTGIEERQALAILSMPLPQLVQALMTTLAGIVTNVDALDAINADERAAMKKALAGIAIAKRE